MVDKALAVSLRLQGKKYEDIANTLHCSVAWCKKNLKGIRRNTSGQSLSKDEACNRILQLVEELRTL